MISHESESVADPTDSSLSGTKRTGSGAGSGKKDLERVRVRIGCEANRFYYNCSGAERSAAAPDQVRRSSRESESVAELTDSTNGAKRSGVGLDKKEQSRVHRYLRSELEAQRRRIR